MYHIEIKNVGKEPYVLMVYNDNGLKRLALFTTRKNAEEAVRLIRMFRIDTAFEWAKVIKK